MFGFYVLWTHSDCIWHVYFFVKIQRGQFVLRSLCFFLFAFFQCRSYTFMCKHSSLYRISSPSLCFFCEIVKNFLSASKRITIKVIFMRELTCGFYNTMLQRCCTLKCNFSNKHLKIFNNLKKLIKISHMFRS